jgi:hypothetical protein
VRGDQEVAILRAQRQEQQAAMAEQQQLMQTAEAAGNAAPMVRAIDASEAAE